MDLVIPKVYNPFAILFNWRQNQIKNDARFAVRSLMTIKARPVKHLHPKQMVKNIQVSDLLKEDSGV